MRLADLRLAVRPRTPYEAMDLGVRLVQAEAGLLWRTWAMVTLPALALVLLFTFQLGITWGSVLLWWLKPLFDMALLGVLSRRVFGETPSRGDILRLLAQGVRFGLIGHLTWRRLSMSRAYLLPVWLLEQLPRAERDARIALLRNQHTGRARWLHLVMAHFEAFLMIAVLSLLVWFAPEGQSADLMQMLTGQQDSPVANGLALAAYFIGMSVVEPFYVAAGFTLYLNRRTELEAWDLELAFRHLRERLESPGSAS